MPRPRRSKPPLAVGATKRSPRAPGRPKADDRIDAPLVVQEDPYKVASEALSTCCVAMAYLRRLREADLEQEDRYAIRDAGLMVADYLDRLLVATGV